MDKLLKLLKQNALETPANLAKLLDVPEAVHEPVARTRAPLQRERGGQTLAQRPFPVRSVPAQHVEILQRLRPIRFAGREE